ncbi:MAG: hypothetical protein QM708_12110 [Propioniciclava sp.]|uniref:hypothetical protein n=1 Tax=Propioniciclava sp. TaxID=2038686 RepID=UPI0039E3E9D3
MSRSTRRLSEVARRLVIPAGIETTGWPAVEFWLKKLGLPFDGWQQGIAKLALGKLSTGVYACTTGGVFLSIPRQVGKTYMLGGLVFALCLLHPGLTVIWTAHRTRTASETYKAMKGMARRRAIAPYVEKTPKNNDEWGLLFTNGSRILFGARENGFGRGFAQVDVLVFDEAQILTDKAMDDMIPAMNASNQPTGGLAIFAGTPPRPTDDSEVFARAREEALSGQATATLWVEFATKKAVDPKTWPAGYVDFEAFEEANPSFPDRTPEASIIRMTKMLSRESLRREGLGIWDEKAVTLLPVSAAAWSAGLVREAPEGPPAYGVKFSPNGLSVAVAAAVLDGNSVHAEVIARLAADDLVLQDMPLAHWLAARFATSVAIVIDGKGGAGALIDQLKDLGVHGPLVVGPTPDQVITAHAQILASINAGTFTHIGQAELNQVVKVATKRPIGTRGGWGWQSIDGTDVVDLDAVTLAAYGARLFPPRKPMRGRVML